MNGYHQPPHFRSALSYSAGLPDLPQPQDDLASRINGRAQPPAASYVPSAIANADYMAHRKAGEAGSRASIASTTSVGSSASGMGGNFFGGPPYPCSMMPPSPSSSSFPMKSSASMGSIYSGADDRVAAVHRWNASESSGTPPRPGSSRTVGGMERAGTLGPDVGSGLGGSHGRDRRSLYQTPSGSSSSLGAEGLGPSMSRDFLVPIGATGARQKLSIVNATQRRRPPTADTALRIHRETRDVSSSEQANLGGSEVVDDAPPASTQWHNTVPRSRSEGNGALAQSGARPSTSSGSSVYAKDRSDGSDHPGSSDRPTSFDGRASQIRAQQMSEFGRSRSTPQGLNFPNSGSANGSGSLPSRRPDRMDSNPGINSSSFYQGSNASSSSSLVPPRSLDLRSSSSDNVFSLGGPSSFKRSETPTPTQERSNPMMNAQLSAPDLTSWKPETSFLEPKTPPPSSSGERRQSEAPMTDPIRHDSRFPESPWGSTSLQGSPVMTRDGSAAGFNGRQISSDASKAAKILGSPDRPSGGFRAAMSKSGSKTFRNLFSRKESQKATPPPTTTNAESYKRSMLASSMEDERSRSPLQSRSQRRVDDVPGSPVILHAQTIRHEKSSSSVEPLDLALSYTSTFPQPPMLDFSLPSSGGLFDDGEAVNNKADGGEDQAESHDLPQQYRLKLSGLDSDDSSDEADRAHASRSSTKDTSVSGSHSPDSPARERSGSLSGTSASLPSAASTTSTFLPEAAELKLDFADLSSLFPDYYGHDVTEALNSESTTARAAVPAEQQARTDSGVASGGSMGAAREEELGLTPRALAQLQANSLLTGSALPTTDKSLPPTPTASSPLTPATPQRTDGATLERTPQPSALRQDLVRGQDLQGDAAPFAGSAVEPSSMNAASPSLNSSISDVEDAHRRAETEMVGPSIRQPIGVGTLQGSGSRPASRSADRPMTAEDGSPSGRATPTQESTISTVPAPSSSRAERSEAWESTSPLMSPRRRPSALSPSLGSSTLAGSNTVAQALLASLAAQKLHASQTAKGVTEEAAQSLDSKPAPAVSKAASRPASIQPDPATLARLENAPLKATSSTPLEAAADTAASKKAKRAEGIDPATYVPAGALSRTRRGAAVSANAAVELQTSSDSARSNQAVNEVEARPSVSSLASGSTPLSPQGQSRFSIASTDDSSVAASADDSSSVAQTDSDSQKASGRGQEDDAETTTDGASVDGQTLPVSAWIEVEAALRRFIDASISTPVDKGALLRSVLLPFLALEAETPNVEVSGEGQFTTGKSRRSLFFEWIRYLLLELQHVQTSADRGAILESIACIIESRNFSTMILQTDPEDDARFSSVFGHILSYAIGELNKKGVYQNTLIFSGRLLGESTWLVRESQH